MVGKGNRQEVIGVGKLGTRKRGVGGVVGTGPRREEGSRLCGRMDGRKREI